MAPQNAGPARLPPLGVCISFQPLMKTSARWLNLASLSFLFILCACDAKPFGRRSSNREPVSEKCSVSTSGGTTTKVCVSGGPTIGVTDTPTPTPEPSETPTPAPTETPTPTPVVVGRAFPPIDRSFPAPNPLPNPANATGFKNTYYYMAFETDFPASNPKTEDVLDMQGNVLATVSAAFLKSLAMEGSGELADGRVLNWAGRVAGKSRYAQTIHYWGRAGGNCALHPFKSIAIDPSFVDQGSTVFIDETLGMKLPDGSLHDGIWYADDTGGAILKDRVDIYTGKKEWAKSLSDAGIKHMQALTIRVLATPAPQSCLNDPAQ